MKRKQLMWIAIGVLVSIALAMLFPSNVGQAKVIDDVSIISEENYIEQDIVGITLQPYEITKVYYQDQLIGVMIDGDLIDEEISNQQASLSEEQAAQYDVSLSTDIILVKEKTFFVYEDKDDEILQLLIDNDMFVVMTIEITIYDSDDNLVDTIYVNSEDDFQNALVRFAKLFISEEVYEQLENGVTIESLTTYGTQETNIYITETIYSQQSGAQADEIFAGEDAIFEYLCYGRDKVEEYYTVVEYDTVEGVASKNGLSTTQLLSINSDIVDADQTLAVGQQINVAYFTSPITVIVEQESYVKEITYAGSTEYISDDTLDAGTTVVETEASDGYDDTLYTEIYVNGVLSGYREEYSVVVVEPVNAVVRVGTKATSSGSDTVVNTYTGDIVFSLPCANAAISCSYNCYSGHSGTDFINVYDRYGSVLACTDGTITQNAYNKSAGYYYRIDAGTYIDEDGNSHHIVLRYGHMKTAGYYSVGTTVTRGQVIGQIGMTGAATGPHVHISIYDNGVEKNPCIYLPCELARDY